MSISAARSDLLILGAGAAGVCAAIEAASRGLRVTVVDAEDGSRNASATSGGGIFIAATPYQQQRGIEDSAELAIEDWLAWGGPDVDLPWARRYIESGPDELFSWLSELGVEWIDLHHQEGNRVPRWHSPKGGGKGVMEVLNRHAHTYPIDFQHGVEVTEIVTEGGRVVGLRGRRADGSELELRAEATLIASGGFSSSPDFVQRYAARNGPDTRVLLGGGLRADGSGHRMLEKLDAQFTNLEAVWCYPYATPDYLDPTGQRGLVCRGLEGDVWVNRDGRRFHNEDKRGGSTGTPALLAQPGATCWTIMDARIAARYNAADPRYRAGNVPLREALYGLLDESPFIAKGETVEDLARAAGLPADNLRDALAEYNGCIANGLEYDPAFGKKLTGLEPVDQPPFYAMQFFPLARKNLGGVRTDLDCRVLDRTDQPIPGLYAAGEVAGMAGGHINGRAGLEGTMFGPVIFSGKVAGRATGA